MTVDEVKAWVEKIKAMSGDSEAAHSEEDSLYFAVLDAISNSKCEDPRACAAEALKTVNIEFERWCA